MSTLNTKIQLRTDDLSNWISANTILKDGEIAIVVCEDGTENIKIGNGLSCFNDLQFLYQSQVKTKKVTTEEVTAKSIAQGYHVKATPTSFATGIFAKADGQFDVVHGIEAEAREGDDYAFVFNGQNLPLDGENFYRSHGEGSFNINPLSGLAGFYIGEKSLSSILSVYLTEHQSLSNYYTKEQTGILYLQLEDKIDNKVKIGENNQPLSNIQELSIVNILAEDYYKLVSEEKVNPYVLYVISSDNVDAHGERIINVASPELSDDATTKDYVDSLVDSIPLSDYYLKSETSSAQQLEKRFSEVSSDADHHIVKAELSGKTLVLSYNKEFDPLSVVLSSYDSEISTLSSAVDLIGNDYLDSYDKEDILNQCLSPDEVKFYRGPGDKDLTLSVGTGTTLSTYTVQLSDFYFSSETSSKTELDDKFQEVEGKIPVLTNYYTKSETSSAIEISTAISSAELVEIRDWECEEPSEVLIGEDILINQMVTTLSTNAHYWSKYNLVEKIPQLTSVGGTQVLCCNVDDSSINTIRVSADTYPVYVYLPSKYGDRVARDFRIRIECLTNSIPTVGFFCQGENVNFESEDDEWASLELGVNLFNFTETK